MKKIWLKNYPPGVPHEIPPLKESLAGLFFKACQEFADQKAFVSFGKSLSYRELRRLSLRLSAGLQSLGLQKGDAIILQMPNILQYPVSLWAALLAGLKVVNMNPLYTEKEMLYQIKDSGAKGIILFSACAEKLERIARQTRLRVIITTEPGDLLGFPKKQAVNFVFRRRQRRRQAPRAGGPAGSGQQAAGSGKSGSMDVGGQPGRAAPQAAQRPSGGQAQSRSWLAFTEILKAAPEKPPFKAPPAGSSQNETLLIQYTGGTTGISKGACLTEGNILANLKQCGLWMTSSLEKGRERALAPLPLYHIFAFLINGLLLFLHGAENILIADPRNQRALLKELKKRPVTVGTGVSALFKALLKNPQFKRLDFSACKFFVSGGMPLEASVQKQWREITGSPLIEGYGLTEASPAVCCSPLQPNSKEAEEGYIGCPLPSTEIRIVDEEGRELPAGEEGELEVRGPQVMKGYHQREKETREAFSPGGWLKTGDIAAVSEKGMVKIKDRKKDMIIVSGFNVYPSEVEEALSLHEEVKEAAVVGAWSESSGEAVKAFVARAGDSLTKEALKSHCRALLAPYKVPRIIEFVEEIPKTNLGKPLRRAFKKPRERLP